MDLVSATAPKHRGTWRTYTDTDGLPTLMYEHAAVDRDGFIWFGSNNSGALRFDGEEFKHFTSKEGLCGHSIYHIHLDRQGRLWFASLDGGVCWWDGNHFYPLEGLPQVGVSAICEDRQGRLWFGGPQLLGCWDGDHFHALLEQDDPIFPPDRSPFMCWGLVEDTAGKIWYGTNSLISYDGQRCRRWGEEEGVPFLPGNNMGYALTCDREATLWLGTNTCRDVRRFNGETFEPVLTGLKGVVRKIQVDLRGRAWICTNGDGVYYYDQGEFCHLTTVDGLVDNTVNGMQEDPEGQFWFTSLMGGISCYDPDTIQVFDRDSGLPHGEMASGLTEDSRGRIWAGLHSFDDSNRNQAAVCIDGPKVSVWNQDDGLNIGNKCSAICEDSKGSMWFSGNATGQLACFDGQEVHPKPLEDPRMAWESRLALDGNGRLYYSYTHLDRALCQWRILRREGHRFVEIYRHTDADITGFNYFEYISALVPARDGGLWFARNRDFSFSSRGLGLSYLSANGQLRHFTCAEGLADERIADLLEDRAGHLWIASHGGLLYFDGNSFTRFTTEDGLPSNQILSLWQDRDDHLWIGTAGGLAHANGSVFQTIRSPVIHAPHRIIQARDGALWLNTRQGLVRYQRRSHPPRVRLLQIVADRIYLAPRSVELQTPTRQVLFEFKGLSFRTSPRDMLYTYKLAGYDEEWHKPSRSRRAYYQELPPGEYVFHVKAIDRDLNYSREAAIVELTVVPDPQWEELLHTLSQSVPTKKTGFIGTSLELEKLRRDLAEVAPTQINVLLQGETGTGKGLAAYTLHQLSQRTGPFIQVNCGSLPAELVESELFGHEKGAFTGAYARKLGKVELAQDGTLFLDEIGDMPLPLQVKLLRLLEEREFERVGGTQTKQAQVRIIAATNRDLQEMVANGRFRKDLFFRLCVFPVHLPPLRKRQKDISELAQHFLRRMATHLEKPVRGFSPKAMVALQNYNWPGNVRELEHAVQRGVIVARNDQILYTDLAIGFETRTESDDTLLSLAEHERRYILQVLEYTNWIIRGPKGAAKLLGLHESTLRSRMKKLGIIRRSP